ncbi:proline dehydrogenase family protein [Burkholderia thailandensis]|uniref:Proline dehydrogenase family protein n=1 Tax=Burkholderia thailandensis TaxID=57975 RepID=A0AAW9D235_BURTH|nr:proline dehydrogenase family protein [Burkholderia thailandensis]AHI64965.1 proline dehydrogenase family protein [Burkholderia thailandensis H0587]AIP64557.1 proline dehydrogenase [Burkholderia thailandensis]AJY30696.1 proline dehydrogenase family protein [Burkholderia thailandensis 34]AOI51021.1 proline dehydrogenase [Burkholderia thailandensis]AOJ50054.1 proline dehydrogenase [Burkholderia thailandensis]
MNNEIKTLAAAALKGFAANPQYSQRFRQGTALREWLQVPASRYIVAGDAGTAVDRMRLLAGKGYEVGLEYVGENVTDRDEVRRIEAQYLQLIDLLPHGGLGRRTELNFDLSNVGLLIAPDLACEVTGRIVAAADEKGAFVTLSMERFPMVDDILSVFHRLAASHANIGITLQAYLHRTPDDLDAVLRTGRKIRLVKGVYDEIPERALPRSPALDDRYAELARRMTDAGIDRSFATQDPALIERLMRDGLLADGAEIEMLHGVQPTRLRDLRRDGVKCRVYGTFGDNWYLHFLHRLAEAPETVLQALADIHDPSRIVFGGEY